MICATKAQTITLTSNTGNDSLFFKQGSTWKYLDDGSNQGTVWQELAFDDSAWDIGIGHMGFGEGDETTILNSGFITYYFRKTVNITDISLLENVFFNIVHDDGAVVYVNGTEVVRSALMPSGTINYNTGTTTYIPNDVENDFWTYQIDKSNFQNGENIIAIEIHNQRTGSSDISFDCYVTNNSSVAFQLDGPYVFYRNGVVVVKTVEASGPQTYVYNTPEEANLICRFENGIDSFAVQLQPELSIEHSLFTLPEKFLAISDIEGNLEAFVMVLKDAGVMDEDYNWAFGSGHLFIVGDMFDRGKNVTECLWLLYRLESQAVAEEGKIHFVMGNHDVMNLIGDFRYVAKKYLDNTQLIGETLRSIYANDSELGRWLRTKNIIERAGPFIFLHGGLSPGLQALNTSYDEINYWGRYRLDNICETEKCRIINGGSDYGVYWYRGMAKEDLTQQEFDDIISDFNGEIVIIGHTVVDNISLLYDGKLCCIDLVHKDNFTRGFMSALYYEDGSIYDFFTDGTTQTFTLLTTISSIRDNHEDILKVCVFPNPANNIINITGLSSPSKIKIYNIQGQLLKSFQHVNNTIDISDLQPGVYFLKLQMRNKTLVRKVVVKR